MKLDPHVHSRFSTRPSQWILQKLGCPESFTAPEAVYRIAKARGMDLVTIADHNTLQGALAIAHLPDAFVSVEITSYFPADGCKVHVLALDVTETQFADIQRCRENVFDLVAYLRAAAITHVCAHPLYGVNDKMTVDHVEELLLLFNHLELNGARDDRPNQALRAICQGLTPADMDFLANKHDLAPHGPEPWRKALTGGSDDHGSRNIARMYTVVEGAQDLAGCLAGIREGRCCPAGQAATPETMAHNLYAIAYQYYKDKFRLERFVGKDIFLRFADRFLATDPAGSATGRSGVVDRLQTYWTTRRYLRSRPTAATKVQDLLRAEAARLIAGEKGLAAIAGGGATLPDSQGQEWFRFVSRVAGRVLTYCGDHLLRQVAGGNVFDIFQTVGSAGALYAVLAPYFVAYGLYSQDRRLAAQVRARLAKDPAVPPRVHVAHFTDTWLEINGVALTLRRSLELARATGRGLTMLTAYPEGRVDQAGVANFRPIGQCLLPEYPELTVYYPPVLEMLHHVWQQDYSHLHLATPGPVGLAGLLIGRILGLPLHATYHTQIPQYARQLTGDDGMEELAWKFTLWFYGQMDKVYAPSQATADELIGRGLAASKVVVQSRGVDIRRFHPDKRNGALRALGLGEGFHLLYVGRVSREKNLELLARAYRQAVRQRPELRLVVVGDGPYLAELRQGLADLPGAVFAGYVEGEALAGLYASADAFVFPSRTDTFGNVVLEAQASGLPVLVSSEGGPQENVVHEVTGLILSGTEVGAWSAAMERLAAHPEAARHMGDAARRSVESRGFAQAFGQTWEQYAQAI